MVHYTSIKLGQGLLDSSCQQWCSCHRLERALDCMWSMCTSILYFESKVIIIFLWNSVLKIFFLNFHSSAGWIAVFSFRFPWYWRILIFYGNWSNIWWKGKTSSSFHASFRSSHLHGLVSGWVLIKYPLVWEILVLVRKHVPEMWQMVIH